MAKKIRLYVKSKRYVVHFSIYFGIKSNLAKKKNRIFSSHKLLIVQLYNIVVKLF